MSYLIVTKSESEAKYVEENLPLKSAFRGYKIWQAHLDSWRQPHSDIHWWRDGDSPPIFPEYQNGVITYWQGNMTAQQFVMYLKYVINKINKIKRNRFKVIQAKFPDFEWEITDNFPFFYIRLERKNSKTPFGLGDKDFEITLKRLKTIKWQIIRVKQLHERYPHLFISAGDMSDQYQYKGIFPNSPPTKWAVWTAHYYDGERHDNVGTGIRFDYPPTKETIKTLDTINREAEKATQDGWFFCSVCWKAKPKNEFAAWHFTEHRCNDCATPEFLRRAANESYN